MTKTIFNSNRLQGEVFQNAIQGIKENIKLGYCEPMDNQDIEELASDIVNDDYYQYYEDELDNVFYSVENFIKRYEKRYKTSVSLLAFIGSRSSHYGSIGGNGAIVGRIVELDSFHDIGTDSDSIELKINENKNLELIRHDHDGTNTMSMILVTESEIERIENKYGYADHEDIFHEIVSKKATKLDNKFIKSF